MELVHSLFIIAIILGLADSQRDLSSTFTTKKYCGSHLAQALSTICRGNYNTLNGKKDLYRKKSYWEPQFATGQSFPFQTRSQAASLMGNYRRRRRQIRGVHNECCEKSCSPEELSAYCAEPYRRRR